MKWGRKKKSVPLSSSSSPSSSSIITRVFFPVSWFSKLKQKSSDAETSSAKHKSELDFVPVQNSSWKKGRFYSMDEDDPYWRLSFGEEKIVQGRRSTGGINPLWYDDSDRDLQFPVSSIKSSGLREMDVSRRNEYRNFNDMVLDVKKIKEMENKQKLKNANDQNSKKSSRRSAREKFEAEKFSNSGEKDIFPIEPENTVQIEEDFLKLAVSNSKNQLKIPKLGLNSVDASVSDWRISEDNKFKGITIKTESENKSHTEKTKKKSKVKAYSPRTECKIRALEDLKKARMKLKKKVVEGKTVFDSFAVVKNSFNPQQDFRDSMVEMIREKGISQSEDLEELLACYLTLNCDEYHDIIIKVFRQVWLEMKGVQYFDY
ncbi:hypothetical protein DH2020_032678 [Rehmannia glutinosa]|uniref:Transcription repressor n=1 Tax=Rehmannia glutinosa TaxID=99300 RepID=A0ABR0VH56_REHGL